MKRTKCLVALLATLSVGLSASAQTTAPKNATVLEFVGTPYTALPAGTDGSVGTGGTYVLFGDWPQTIMAAGVTVDESKVAVVGAHTYYKGSDGAWYMKMLENGEASNGSGPGGFLQTGFTPTLQGKIAVTTVENSSRQNSGLDLIQKELTAVDRSIYDGTMYYERGEEHKRVYYPKFTGNNTKDKVFILILKEVSRSDYGFVRILDGASPETTYRGLAHPMTDFARGHGVAHFSDDVVTTWWLRTPVLPIYFHRVIEEREDQEVGAVTSHSSLGLGMVGDPSVSVVPAICVN